MVRTSPNIAVRGVYVLADPSQGLWDAQKNIRALRSTGGNVEAAIELIFSGQLDHPGHQ
jgi:hypothetical protein